MRTKITIALEIECDDADVLNAVDRALDVGTIQDAIADAVGNGPNYVTFIDTSARGCCGEYETGSGRHGDECPYAPEELPTRTA